MRVALHGRRVGGWVVALDPEPPPGVALQALTGFSGLGPPPAVLDLAAWGAWRWAGPVSALLQAASPPRVVRELPPAPRWTPDPVGNPGELDVLAQFALDAARAIGHPSLVRLGPATDPWPLLEGVLRWGDPRAGSVLVLVPSVGWAERLAVRMGHHGVPAVDVAHDWAAAAAGWPVVVGARGGAWAPVPELRAAVVLDAHDPAYREERAPTYDAWEVVAERAARAGAPCLLVSACPTAVQAERCTIHEPSRATERGGWPALVVVDRRAADPRTGLLSEELVRLARSVVAASGPTTGSPITGGRWAPMVCVLNRTGRAKLLACAACGELVRCEECGRALALVDGRLACAGCGQERPVVCAGCGATRLKLLRPGISRVREELEALVGTEVVEVSAQTQLAGEPQVLVGTEAVLHRVRRAAAVAFLDFDQHLLASRFTAAEEAIGLLARAGRLVGARAASARGLVLVQTRMADHPVIAAARLGDPSELVSSELALRRSLGLPPVSALALLSGPGAPEFAAALAAPAIPGKPGEPATGEPATGERATGELATGELATGELGDPSERTTGELAELAVSELGDGRWLVRAPDDRALADRLAATPRPRARLRVEVDPTSV